MRKKLKGFLMVLLILSFLSGCRDQMEVDRITFPLALGIDWDNTTQKIKIYAQVSVPASGQGVQTEARKNFSVKVGEGETLSKAFTDLFDHVQQNISWKHVVAVIITEELAQRGMADLLDMLCRHRDFHINSYFLITKDNLQELLGTNPKIESGLASPFIAISLINTKNNHSKPITIKDFVTAYLNKEISPVLPRVSIYSLEKTPQGINIELEFKGLGVFKQDKLIGWLDEDEIRGLNFTFGIKYKERISLYTSQNDSEPLYTIRDLYIEAKKKAEFRSRPPTLHLELKAKYALGESNSSEILDTKHVSQINDLVEASIKSMVKGVIQKAQKELKADIFGFGGMVYRKNPKYWEKNKDQWDQIFSTAPIKVEVEALLVDTEELTNSLTSKLK